MMLPLTEHASQRAGSCVMALALATGRLSEARRVVQELLDAVPPARESIAVYAPVPTGVKDRKRQQWCQVTHLVVVAREGKIVSVFFTRRNQLNPAHLRVERIEEAK